MFYRKSRIFISTIASLPMLCCAAPDGKVSKDRPGTTGGLNAPGRSMTALLEHPWLDKTIIPGEEFIYSVGHSHPADSQEDAKDDAVSDATKEFVKYCRVDVQSFDRSIEIYSRQDGKDFNKLDVEARNIIRARAFVSRAIPEDWYIRTEGGKHIASVLLKVPRDEFDRILNEKNIKLSLDVALFYEGASGAIEPLTEGKVLRSGDGYAIYIRPSDMCYIYVYQVDALEKTYRLFPNRAFNTGINPVPASDEVWIPNGSELLELDETTGKEYFYVFASPEAVPEFENGDNLTFPKKYIDNLIEVRKMGVAGIREKRGKGEVGVSRYDKPVSEMMKKLQAEGAFVYERWFWHK